MVNFFPDRPVFRRKKKPPMNELSRLKVYQVITGLIIATTRCTHVDLTMGESFLIFPDRPIFFAAKKLSTNELSRLMVNQVVTIY